MEKEIEIITPSQEKLISLLMVEYGKTTKRRSMKSILLEAGYSPNSAKNPKIILSQPTVAKAIDKFVDRLDNRAERIMQKTFTDKKIDAMSPSTGAYVLDILIKNSRLLQGKTTANHGIVLEPEEMAELDAIIVENEILQDNH